jgi:Zn-dependent peptidase ImmA (M78 family)
MSDQLKLNSDAEELRTRFGIDNNSKVDVISLALSIPSLTLVFYPFSDNISGMCIKDDNPLIAVNSKMSYGRQRFTIAHEFYHLFYENSIGTTICSKTDMTTKKSKIELDADTFASFFLVPYTTLRRYIENEKLNPTIDPTAVVKIEQQFGISRQAILLRLEKQGYKVNPDAKAFLSSNISQYAASLGYSRKLYEPSDVDAQYQTLGSYLEKAQELYNKKLISKGKYEEYLSDAYRMDIIMNVNPNKDIYD